MVVKMPVDGLKLFKSAEQKSMVLQAASPINGTTLHPAPDAARMPLGERRRRPRAALQWRIHIYRSGHSDPLVSTSKNISSQGFYCLAQESCEPGECLECSIFIPTQQAGEDTLRLKCSARVLRVEPAPNAGFGLACQIEDYTLERLSGPMGQSGAEWET
jgi:hypothetical protein